MIPTDKALSLVAEFKKFAFKGNVVDLAVAVIIGGAFGKIVDSLVKNVLMPAVSLLLPSEGGYLSWKLAVGGKEILYGQFLGEVVNFLIVAGVLYIFIVKFLGWMMRARKDEAAAPAPPVPPPPTRDQELLAEIRDLLKVKST
jgi:large conductance mechanosensitive channel